MLKLHPDGTAAWRSDWYRSRQRAERVLQHLQQGGSLPLPFAALETADTPDA